MYLYNYVFCTATTYVGLLHCLSLYLTPMPQDLVQAEDGPNPPHCPSTGVKSVELGMQLPRTHICSTCIHIKYTYVIICKHKHIKLITL